MDVFRIIWNDPVWSGVITAGIIALGSLCFHKRRAIIKYIKSNRKIILITSFIFIFAAAVIIGGYRKEIWQWLQGCNKEYKITYHLNGGKGGENSKYTKCSDTIFLPMDTIKKEGYKFAGWYDNERFEGDSIIYIPKGSKGDKEFWAKWTLDKFNTLGRSTTMLDSIPNGSTGSNKFVTLKNKKPGKEDTIPPPIVPPVPIPVNEILLVNTGETEFAFDRDVRIRIKTIQQQRLRIVGEVSIDSNNPVELETFDKLQPPQKIGIYTIQVIDLQKEFAKFKITKQTQ